MAWQVVLCSQLKTDNSGVFLPLSCSRKRKKYTTHYLPEKIMSKLNKLVIVGGHIKNCAWTTKSTEKKVTIQGGNHFQHDP